MPEAEFPANDDSLLVRLLIRGDEAAFERLYNKYSKGLFYFVFRILNSKEEAEGLVQDVFVKIWEDRANLNADLSFSGYIFTIAKNTTSNLFRKSVNREVYQRYIKRNNSITESQTENDISLHELQAAIENLINSLPPKRKLIYKLNRERGLSREEIAIYLGVAVGTVDNQLIKARRFIKEGLSSYFNKTSNNTHGKV